MQEEKDNKFIDIEDFIKFKIQVGEIKEVVEVEGSDKLFKLKVDFGEEADRIVFSGIKKFVSKEDLLNKKFIFVTNLKPRKIMNEYSEAMILAGQDENNFSLFSPINSIIKNGTELK